MSESSAKRVRVDSAAELDAATQRTLELIDSRQSELDQLNEKASEEILRVEQKFNRERQPLYEKRAQLIRGVPHFWLTAFINHPQVSAVIGEDEEQVLQHLASVEVQEFEDIKSGYSISFHFDENNAHFDNATLVKEFHLGTNGEPYSKHTKIVWKEGKDLSAKARLRSSAMEETNAKNKAGKKRRHLEPKSFFAWYEDDVDPSVDDIAEAIKDDIWPNPLQYFLVPDIEVENGNDEDEDNDDDDDEDDEEEEEPEDSVVVLEEEEEEEEQNDEVASKGEEEKTNEVNSEDVNKDSTQ